MNTLVQRHEFVSEIKMRYWQVVDLAEELLAESYYAGELNARIQFISTGTEIKPIFEPSHFLRDA